MKDKEGPSRAVNTVPEKAISWTVNPQGQCSAQPLIVAFYLPLKGTDFHDSTDARWLLGLVCAGHSVGIVP